MVVEEVHTTPAGSLVRFYNKLVSDQLLILFGSPNRVRGKTLRRTDGIAHNGRANRRAIAVYLRVSTSRQEGGASCSHASARVATGARDDPESARVALNVNQQAPHKTSMIAIYRDSILL